MEGNLSTTGRGDSGSLEPATENLNPLTPEPVEGSGFNFRAQVLSLGLRAYGFYKV